jgi:transposase
MKSIYQSVESKERASASFNNRAKLNFNNKIKKLKENLIYWESQKDSIKKTIKIKSLSKKIKKMHSFLKEPDKVNWKKIDKIKNKINKLERKQNDKQNHLFYNKAHEIIDTSCLIKVGDVSGKLLQKLGGKSAKKASIGKFKDKLKWIGLKREVPVIIVNEAHSTVTCSKCKEKTGPTGIKMLNVRYWTCSKCDSVHDRDINASINIKEKEILVS